MGPRSRRLVRVAPHVPEGRSAGLPAVDRPFTVIQDHLALAKELRALRRRGVLIVGSGNIVHNLPAMRYGIDAYDWAREFDGRIAEAITRRDYAALAEIDPRDPLTRVSHPTIEHLLPLLYALGAAEETDTPQFFTEGFDLGSISMRSVLLAA